MSLFSLCLQVWTLHSLWWFTFLQSLIIILDNWLLYKRKYTVITKCCHAPMLIMGFVDILYTTDGIQCIIFHWNITFVLYIYFHISDLYSAYLYILEATLGPELVFTIAEESSTSQFDYWVVHEHWNFQLICLCCNPL